MSTKLIVAVAAFGLGIGGLAADAQHIVLQSTTSTQNSGLLDFLAPQLRADTGIELRVVAVGTGQALRNARNGDADVLLVHDPQAEEAFVADGHGVERFDVMYNDFIIVGPRADPARVADTAAAEDALAAIARSEEPFASRGDDSGTHKKELTLWKLAAIDAPAASGTWYRETGTGMGATLNIAVGMDAYALTDRATWISFKNKQDHLIVSEGDPKLFNQYGVILVNPARHSRVKGDLGQRFIDWLLGDAGQQAIASFRVDGQQLFFPNAGHHQ